MNYFFNKHTDHETDEIFNKVGFETTGINPAKVYKYDSFYIKVYDEGLYNYHVMGYKYHLDTPFIDKIMTRKELKDFVKEELP